MSNSLTVVVVCVMSFPRFLTALLAVGFIQVLASVTFAERFYVSDDASSGGDGASWETAFTFLQDALDQTVAGRGDEVWIEAGTYYPDDGANVTVGDRTASFNLVDGVVLYGGFAGGESNIGERDWETNISLLSGEIVDGDENKESWSFHVCTTSDGSSITFDGVTVSKGNANDSYGEAGAVSGMAFVDVFNSTFSDNSAVDGGVALNGAWNVVNSVFDRNSATRYGGVFSGTLMTAVDTTFSNNAAGSGGVGGGNNWTVVRCRFLGNTASEVGGGGVVSVGGVWKVFNSVFQENSAVLGGVSSFTTWHTTNSVYHKNSATQSGGVAYGGNWNILSCTFLENSESNISTFANGDYNTVNSIFWDSQTAEMFANLYSFSNYDPNVDPWVEARTPETLRGTNIIRGGLASISLQMFRTADVGSGSILDSQPLFIDMLDPDGSDNVWGTADDGLRHDPNSPAIGQGDSELLILDAEDLDFDSVIIESIPIDIADFTRVQEGVLDLGAYEYGNDKTPIYSLTVYSSIGGQTNSDGIMNYAPGMQVSISAVASNGFVFSSWLGDASGSSNPLFATMDNNKTVIANFDFDLSDEDDDGLTAYDEYLTYGTDPNLADTSGDGIADGNAVAIGIDPASDYSSVINAIKLDPIQVDLYSVSDIETARLLGQQDVTNNPVAYDLHTTTEITTARTNGRTDVTSDPATYSLHTASEVTASRTAGQNDVTSDPATYDLFTQTQLDARAESTTQAIILNPSSAGLFASQEAIYFGFNQNLIELDKDSLTLDWSLMRTEDLSVWEEIGKVEIAVPKQEAPYFFRFELNQ